MRCLQCGKEVPLLKRMAGSEFCSVAHRREYQQEYSQLALGRLLQSKPTVLDKGVEASIPAPVPTPAATANGHAAPVSVTEPVIVTVAKKPTVARREEPKHSIPLPPASVPTKKVAADPAIAPASTIEKPAPAAGQATIAGTAEFEHALSLLLARPSRQASMTAAALPEASPIPLKQGSEMADATMHPIEPKLELRDAPRSSPRINLNLGIIGSESLTLSNQGLMIPVVSAIAPTEAGLWIADPRNFTGSVISLGIFAKLQFSTTGFEEPGLVGSARSAAEAEPRPQGTDASKADPAALETGNVSSETDIAAALPRVEIEPRREAPSEPPATVTTAVAAGVEAQPITAAKAAGSDVPVPDPVTEPLPVAVQGIAAGRVKPAPVFGPAPFSGKRVQLPPPSGLPLRPVMVLGPAEAIAAPVVTKKREADVRILPPVEIKPTLPAAKTQAASSAEPNLGLPELRLQRPQDPNASRLPKIMAAVAGAAVIGFGSFFFLSRGGSESKTRVEASAPRENWIANFATDTKRDRKISVLQSSMNLPSYQVDFESSIQIKGLGWVYRAHDAKNYYVSKIELEKAGQNPTFVIAHYAVIDGIEQPRVEAPLRVGVPLGGHYKIRFAAVGDRFTTWVQDQQVDQWTDTRLTTGGAGLLREGAEQFTVYGNFQVTPLSKEK